MGGATSTLRQCLEDEFSRLSKGGRDYLVLGELLGIKLPSSAWTLEPAHLASLFVADRNHDGRFDLNELVEFMSLANERTQKYHAHEFRAQMEAECTLRLFEALSNGNGPANFTAWMKALLTENGPTKQGTRDPSQTFLGRNTLADLFYLLRLEEKRGTSFEDFFELLQEAAEEQGLLVGEAEGCKDWVPLQCVEDFISNFNDGAQHFMAATFPEHYLKGAHEPMSADIPAGSVSAGLQNGKTFVSLRGA